ncbi:MAG: C_GCAxxG_C_C family protein [Lachnospiraceae bacterium]|jgi:hypothetical protein|nr:C_GCAxxG_C_C family protein [Lachnospiraceae bacterium]
MAGNDAQEKTYTRREVLKMAGTAAAGIAVASVVPSFLTGCSKKEIPSKEVLDYEYMEKSEDAAPYPYPYQKLDIETAKERAYAGFFNKGGCCRAVIDAIAGELADQAGYPWNQIPVNAFANGAGGFGAASLCGSLGGAATVIGLAIPPEDAASVTAELFKWYTSTELPVYQPEVKNETVTAASVDCKDSVGLFIQKTGYAMDAPERKARCAGVAADTAGKTVELINNYYNL